jgi:hypothetical protein
METIQMQVSPNLAQRLRSHYHELPQILEWRVLQNSLLRRVAQGHGSAGAASLRRDSIRAAGAEPLPSRT